MSAPQESSDRLSINTLKQSAPWIDEKSSVFRVELVDDIAEPETAELADGHEVPVDRTKIVSKLQAYRWEMEAAVENFILPAYAQHSSDFGGFLRALTSKPRLLQHVRTAEGLLVDLTSNPLGSNFLRPFHLRDLVADKECKMRLDEVGELSLEGNELLDEIVDEDPVPFDAIDSEMAVRVSWFHEVLVLLRISLQTLLTRAPKPKTAFIREHVTTMRNLAEVRRSILLHALTRRETEEVEYDAARYSDLG